MGRGKFEKWKIVVSVSLLMRNKNAADVRNNKDHYSLYLMYDTLKNNLKFDGKHFWFPLKESRRKNEKEVFGLDQVNKWLAIMTRKRSVLIFNRSLPNG